MFLGVLAHHLGRQQQMTRPDRRELAAGARLGLDQVPPDILAACYRSCRPERQKLLAPLVRGRVRRVAA